MGCWNETCAISHLPITYGMKTVAIPIIEARHEGHGIYPTDYWGIFLPPVRGTYNDYGSVKNTDDKMFEYLAKRFLIEGDSLIEENGSKFIESFISSISQGEYKFDMNEIAHQAGMDGWAKIQGDIGNKRVRVMLIREDVYDEAIAHTECGQNMWQFCLDECEREKESIELDKRFFAAKNILWDEKMQKQELTKERYAYARGIYAERPTSYPHYYMLCKFSTEYKDEEFKAKAEEMVKLSGALNELRMCYGPASGSGSQDEISPFMLYMHKRFAEIASDEFRREDW